MTYWLINEIDGYEAASTIETSKIEMKIVSFDVVSSLIVKLTFETTKALKFENSNKVVLIDSWDQFNFKSWIDQLASSTPSIKHENFSNLGLL